MTSLRRVRAREAVFLAGWLAGARDLGPGRFQRPPTEDLVVIGNCDTLEGNYTILTPLHDGLALAGLPVMASLDPAVPLPLGDPSEKWTTFLDKMVIDEVPWYRQPCDPGLPRR